MKANRFVLALLLIGLVAIKLPAQTLKTLASFNGSNGQFPNALTLGNDGNLYGTAGVGGRSGPGTVFKLMSNGTLTNLYSFTGGLDGGSPLAALTLGNDGNFYGTTEAGGSNGFGTIFQVTTNGALTTLVSFANTNGAYPYAGLTLGNDGNFYGATPYGGITNENLNGFGTLFKVTTNGVLTALVLFNVTNGASPYAGLTLGNDGNFYGTTWNGGSSYYGTVFKMTPNGTLTTLASFNSTNGFLPDAALTLGNDGNFYGTSELGGITNSSNPFGMGTIFQVMTNGTLTTLVSFNGTNGANPHAALTLGNDGNFYGTTEAGGSYNDNGTVFKVTTNGTLTTLVSFANTNGAYPEAALTLGADGIFYGTTGKGGSSGAGTVFRLLLPATPPTLTLQFLAGYPLLSMYGTLGDTYTVEYTTNLAVPNWTPMLIVPNLSVSPFQMIDPAGVGQPTRFYRAIGSQ